MRHHRSAGLLAAVLWVGGAGGIALGAGAAGGGGVASGGGGTAAGGGGHASGGGAVSSGGSAGGGEHTAGGGVSTGGGTSHTVAAPAGGSGTAIAPERGSAPSGTVGTGAVVHAVPSNGVANGAAVGERPVASGAALSRGAITEGRSDITRGRQGRNGGGQLRGPADQRGRNPYVPQGYQNGNYGVVYGYPFYPFSYGWNPGWYGSGYNNGYNNYTGYNFLDNGTADNGTYPQSTYTDQAQQATTPQQTTTVTPLVTGGSSVAAQAQIANAVDKTPALISADGAVTQAQSAYNEARERALATLRQQPDYQQALARRRAAAGAVGAAKATDGGTTPSDAPPSNAVVSAASSKLEAGDEVTKMEEQAVASDPAAASAKARLDQATADRDALKAQLTAQYQQSIHGG